MAHPGHLQQVAVDCLLSRRQARLLAKVVRSQLTEVIVWVDVIQRQYEIDECFAAAQARPVSLKAANHTTGDAARWAFCTGSLQAALDVALMAPGRLHQWTNWGPG